MCCGVWLLFQIVQTIEIFSLACSSSMNCGLEVGNMDRKKHAPRSHQSQPWYQSEGDMHYCLIAFRANTICLADASLLPNECTTAQVSKKHLLRPEEHCCNQLEETTCTAAPQKNISKNLTAFAFNLQCWLPGSIKPHVPSILLLGCMPSLK